jgi:hypothetical protein
MSTMRFFFLIIFLVNRCYSTNDLVFQIQPQLVRINNHDEIYVTKDDHYIGQVLYRYDQIKLACECQTQLNHTESIIYWTINNKIVSRYNHSNSIQLVININTVQVPITYVKCHCIFIRSNLTKTKIDYKYKLYIGKSSFY